ncbi:MAG TPA: sigma-70 family RNA polymerase sigma factor [Candidatus Limiplasma sp.]|nr:sigma-70 family RNA polymerase sigma factor [Candidatus Limiplasma sp.]HRX09268.1 sigma-70 family RNA polymerase sigma factor [Candidatus Limiplasma sp.]
MLPMLILAIEDDRDRELITTVYLQNRTLMLRAIRKAGFAYHDAEDVMNDVLIRLIQNLKTLRELNSHSLRKYIYSTVKTTAIRYYIKQDQRAHNEFFPQYDIDNIQDTAQRNPEEFVIQLSEIERLKDALKALPAYEYEILFMREYDGLTDSEIAAILDKKENSIRAYASRAYRHAKEILTQD